MAPAAAPSIRISGRFQARAAIVPQSWNEEAGTVDLVWTTGARGKRWGFIETTKSWGEYLEELEVTPEACDLSRLNNRAPLLAAHNAYTLDGVIGVVLRAWIKDGAGYCTVKFSERPECAALRADVKAGVIAHVSVGYDPEEYEDVGEENGMRIMRAVRWSPMEVSLVPIGFDDGAVVRDGRPAAGSTSVPIVRGTSSRKGKPMAKVTEKRADDDYEDKKDMGGDSEDERAEGDDEDEDKKKKEMAEGDSEDEGAEEEEEEEKENKRAANDNGRRRSSNSKRSKGTRGRPANDNGLQRVKEIRTAARMAGLSQEDEDELIDSGVGVDEARKQIIEKLGKRDRDTSPPHPGGEHDTGRVRAGEDRSDKVLRGAGDWLVIRYGQAGLLKRAAEKKGEPVPKFDAGEFGGQSLLDLSRQFLEARGVRTTGMSRMTLAGMALGLCDRHGVAIGRGAGSFQRRGLDFNTTSDFTTLLENVMHKTLLARYQLFDAIWPRLCRTGSVVDFRPSNLYRPGTFGKLQPLNENGRFQFQGVPDGEKQTITATTKGAIVALSRQAIINDDLGVFLQIGSDLGQQAQYTIERDLFDLINSNSGQGPAMFDGFNLFDNTNHHNNPAGAAIGVNALDLDRVAMALQKDPSGQRVLALRPYILLVPTQLEGTARSINRSEWDTDAVGVALPNKFQVPNKVQGLFTEVIGTPLITTSTTIRYLLADPALYPTFEVAFVDGQDTPFLEMRQSFEADGVEWKARLDYGVGAIDWRSAVMNLGA